MQYNLLYMLIDAHYLTKIQIKHSTVAVSRYNWYRNCLYARQNQQGQVDLIVPQLILQSKSGQVDIILQSILQLQQVIPGSAGCAGGWSAALTDISHPPSVVTTFCLHGSTCRCRHNVTITDAREACCSC